MRQEPVNEAIRPKGPREDADEGSARTKVVPNVLDRCIEWLHMLEHLPTDRKVEPLDELWLANPYIGHQYVVVRPNAGRSQLFLGEVHACYRAARRQHD